MGHVDRLFTPPNVSLATVLRTPELQIRRSRPPDYGGERRRLAAIIREITESSIAVLRRTAAEALLFCRAHSAGVSVLAEDSNAQAISRLVIVGPWACYEGSHAPREFSPYGVVLERCATQLFQQPARYYPYLAEARPPIFEVLLAPFEVQHRAAGAIWVMLHDETRRFDGEDERRLMSLAHCASAAYQLAVSLGAVLRQPISHSSLVSDLTRLHATLASANIPQPKRLWPNQRALSRREQQICLLVAQGHTNLTIAEALGISEKTVVTYRSRATDKLGFRNRADFVTYAITQGWLQRR